MPCTTKKPIDIERFRRRVLAVSSTKQKAKDKVDAVLESFKKLKTAHKLSRGSVENRNLHWATKVPVIAGELDRILREFEATPKS